MTEKTFIKLFMLGFLIVFLGIILIVISVLSSEGSISFGGVILVGPIPIFIGGGPHAFLLIMLAFIFTIISIVLFVLLRKQK